MYMFILLSALIQEWSEVTQLCPTLCDPVDCSPSGSSIHGILQARILEWVAISFSNGSSRPRDQTQVSRIAGRCFNLWATSIIPLISLFKLLTWFWDFNSNVFPCFLLGSTLSCYCSVAKSCLTLCSPMNCNTPRPSLSPGVCSNSCLLSQWCHPTISSSVVPFSSCPQSFPATGSFPVSQFFTSGDQSIGVSTSALFLPI